MDVTPQLIEQIDFVERRHGYDQDEVDEFLERVGATIASLQAQVADLSGRATRAEAEVVALREQPPEPRALTDEEDVEQATRTLVLAKRTAEAAISEARQEAAKLVSDARTRADAETTEATAEADRLVREAHAQREEMLRIAREEVDAETAAQRDRLQAEIASLEQRKAALASDVELIEGRLDEYRTQLEDVASSIRAVLDDPASLSRRPTLDLTATAGSAAPSEAPTGSAFYYTGSNPVVSAADSTPLAPGLGDTAAHATVDAARDDALDATAVETAPGDPWSPGSWSEVSSALEGSEPIDVTLFDEPGGTDGAVSPFDEPAQGFDPAAQGAEEVRRSNVDTPTEAYTDLGNDRYLRDLDQAVNRSDADDSAMSEFFEGSEGSGTRRFGRRR